MSEQQAKRERGTGSFFPRGRVVWVQWSHRGTKHREPARMPDGKTPLTIETPNWEKRAKKLLQQKTGAAAAGVVQDDRSIRYEDLRDAYLAAYELSDRNKALRRDKEGNLYLEAVKRLDDFFAAFRAIEIDTDQIRKFQREMKAKGLSNGTINRSVAALRRMFTIAAQEEKLRNVPHFPMLKEARPRSGTLPHEKYLALVEELPDYLRPVVAIGFNTGMRLGEILGLRWDNVLWLDRIIRIEDSKNGEAREIPFTGELETALRAQFSKRQDGCDRVCFRLDHKGHARPIGNFRKPWRRACVKIGVGRMEPVLDSTGQPVFQPKRYARSKPKPQTRYAGLIFHDLRRTFVTDAEHAGAPRHEAMKLSGHKTEAVYKRYAIDNREQRRAVVTQIENYRAQKFGHNTVTVEQERKTEASVTN